MKGLILAEMGVLYGGGLLTAHAREGGSWTDLLVKRALRQGIAVCALGALLLVLADAGLGGAAAGLGGLIVLGYLLAAGGLLGPAVLELERRLFA
jgi:hypothetical protein